MFRPLRPGAEVHNTYGELGNSELVAKYGFALRDNPLSSVRLDKEALLAAAGHVLGSRELRARSRFLRDHTELLDPEEEPLEVRLGGRLAGCVGWVVVLLLPLLLLLRALESPC